MWPDRCHHCNGGVESAMDDSLEGNDVSAIDLTEDSLNAADDTLNTTEDDADVVAEVPIKPARKIQVYDKEVSTWIKGFEVIFPFPPYGIQISYMSRVLSCMVNVSPLSCHRCY